MMDFLHPSYDLIYIYDILITWNNDAYVQQFIIKLSELFSMKDLGPLQYFLGIEAVHSSTGLHLIKQSTHWTCYLTLIFLK